MSETSSDHKAKQIELDAGRLKSADAKRNLVTLLYAAKEAFAESDADVPVREIAKRAGVSIGTLYRDFPRCADLIAAVFRQEIEACADAADAFAASYPPFQALALWIRNFANGL